MSKSDHVDHVAAELREMASTGVDVPAMLRWIRNSFDRNDCRFISVKCFHKAFGGGVASVSPIGRWSGFGGELSDARVQSLVSPVLKTFRDRAQKKENGAGPRTAILRGLEAGKKDGWATPPFSQIPTPLTKTSPDTTLHCLSRFIGPAR